MRLFLVSMSLGVAVLSLNGCFTISDDDSTNGGKGGSSGSAQSGGSGGSTAGAANVTGGTGGSSAGTVGAGGRMGRAGTGGFLPPSKGGTGSGGDEPTIGGAAGEAETGGSSGKGGTGGTGGTGTGGTTAKGGSGGTGGSGGSGGSTTGSGGTAGVPGGPTMPGTCADYSQHLVDCAVLGQAIDCTSLGKNPSKACYYGCYQEAACGTLVDYECNQVSNSLSDCLSACDTFPCGDGSTVPSDFVCDGEKDCSNNADEQGCVAAPAFKCGSGETIAGSSRCDGYPDCADSSDEKGCPMQTCPRPTAPVPGAACGDAATTLKGCGLLPGGVMTSCLDRTEYSACNIECYATASCSELTGFFCTTTSAGDPVKNCVAACNALSDTFPCTTGTDTVPGSDICDGYPDCKDGSDENNCMFKCATGNQSIPENYTCDGEADCADGSDETGCKATCN